MRSLTPPAPIAARAQARSGVNHLGTHGRWAFAEFTEVYRIQADFAR